MFPLRKKHKLYCYVDETGQDTKGRFFLVALVLTGTERDELTRMAESIEQDSGKGIAKWKKTSHTRRAAYVQQLMHIGLFRNKIRYAVFSNRRDYREMTIQAIASAVDETAVPPYEVTVLIDGLGKTERLAVGLDLRRRGISVEKVRGISDEADALIRLADAMAGFVRGYLEGNPQLVELYQQAAAVGLLKKIGGK